MTQQPRRAVMAGVCAWGGGCTWYGEGVGCSWYGQGVGRWGVGFSSEGGGAGTRGS